MSKKLPNQKTLEKIAYLEYKIVEQQSLADQYCRDDGCKKVYLKQQKMVYYSDVNFQIKNL